MTLTLSQGYDLENTRSFEDERPQHNAGFPVRLDEHSGGTLVKPHSLVDLAAQAEYDPVMNRARRYSVNLGFMDGRGDLFSIAPVYGR